MLSMYRDADGQMVVDIKDCETMKEVKILKMGSLGLTDFDVQMFSQLNNLEEMDISDNLLDTIPECITLPKLRRLNCSNNRFTDLQFVRQFPSLEEMVTDGNQVSFADFCIASYLCPSLKKVNDQAIDIVTLNRMVENRVKPLIFKVWNNHVKLWHGCRHTMNDAEFQPIAEKFRLLLKHVIQPMTKTISKFHNFRTTLLIDEFLSKVRKEEDIEFGGSADSVKRNYTKIKKEGTVTDPLTENVAVSVTEQAETSAIVVAVADEDGNSVLTISDVRSILTSDQLNEASTVTIFVENLDVVAETETNQTEEERDGTEDSTPPQEIVESNEKDFIDVETERIKALEEAKSVSNAENDLVSRVATLENNESVVVNCDERLKSKNHLPGSVDESGNGDEKKVVRYWMYEGPKPKSLPSDPGSGMPTSRSLGKKENNPVNGTLSNNTRRTSVRSHRGRPASSLNKRCTDKSRADLISKMKSDGSIPVVPKMKVPAIDARQAAMVVCEMHSAPMVVYRGRCKRESWNSYASKSTTKQAVKTDVVVAESEPTDAEPTKQPIVYQTRSTSKKLPIKKEGIKTELVTSEIKSELSSESESKDVSVDSHKCPPKKRVRFLDQDHDTNLL